MSAETLRRIAIVPAYNEERNIARVIAELKEYDPGLDIVVVSDGSVDHTDEVARDAGAKVLQLPFNLGIGGAVQTGSATPGRTATSSRSGVTATASTSLPSCRR